MPVGWARAAPLAGEGVGGCGTGWSRVLGLFRSCRIRGGSRCTSPVAVVRPPMPAVPFDVVFERGHRRARRTHPPSVYPGHGEPCLQACDLTARIQEPGSRCQAVGGGSGAPDAGSPVKNDTCPSASKTASWIWLKRSMPWAPAAAIRSSMDMCCARMFAGGARPCRR